jgi:RNA polymerase-binding transcription factor DksA
MKATSIADAPSHEGLSATRIDCLREELQQELARLTHSLAAAWPQEVQVENRNRFSVRHTDAGSLTSDLYDRLQERRAVIVGALERMRVGTYGRCAVCGLSIPYERLQVLPETCTCIECGA